jgi:hypothetical protein
MKVPMRPGVKIWERNQLDIPGLRCASSGIEIGVLVYYCCDCLGICDDTICILDSMFNMQDLRPGFAYAVFMASQTSHLLSWTFGIELILIMKA